MKASELKVKDQFIFITRDTPEMYGVGKPFVFTRTADPIKNNKILARRDVDGETLAFDGDDEVQLSS